MKRIFLLLFLLLELQFAASAQHVLGITLVVSGDGATKEEAVSNALRSAIEQTYGTFISANTAILNDELIRDEIVSVSSGNIEKYEEISHSVADDNTHTVNLQVTVSISKLTSFAKSKGSSAELAGNTFAMNMKLRKLNKENEKMALENLLKQVEIMSKEMFDFEMIIGEPRVAGKDGVLYELEQKYKNETSTLFLGDYTNRYEKSQKVTHTGYYIPLTINTKINKNTELVISTIANTLASLSLSEEELNYYKQHSIPYFILASTPTNNLQMGYYDSNFYKQKGVKPTTYYLRSFEYAQEFIYKLVQIINHASYGYTIVANNNPEIYFTLATLQDNRPTAILSETYSYDYDFDLSQVFAYSGYYNVWIMVGKAIRIAEVQKDKQYYNDKMYDFGYSSKLLNSEGTLVKSDQISLFIKEAEMMELTGLQLIP